MSKPREREWEERWRSALRARGVPASALPAALKAARAARLTTRDADSPGVLDDLLADACPGDDGSAPVRHGFGYSRSQLREMSDERLRELEADGDLPPEELEELLLEREEW